MEPELLDELVAGVRGGDMEAIGQVYRLLAPGLRAFLRAEVAHGEVADDLVEATFVELIEDRRRFRGDGRALRSWLYRAARNNLYDWRRRAARRADHPLEPEQAALLVDDEPDPERQVTIADEIGRVRALMARLSPGQREVLELRLLSGLSVPEIAAATGRSVGAVKALQHRGLRSLAPLLEAAVIEP